MTEGGGCLVCGLLCAALTLIFVFIKSPFGILVTGISATANFVAALFFAPEIAFILLGAGIFSTLLYFALSKSFWSSSWKNIRRFALLLSVIITNKNILQRKKTYRHRSHEKEESKPLSGIAAWLSRKIPEEYLCHLYESIEAWKYELQDKWNNKTAITLILRFRIHSFLSQVFWALLIIKIQKIIGSHRII